MGREQERGRESPGREPGEGTLDAAARRLDRALAGLEARLSQGAGRAASDVDRDHLAAELEASRARERTLEAIAAEASAALGRAAAEVRAALAGTEEEAPRPGTALDSEPAEAAVTVGLADADASPADEAGLGVAGPAEAPDADLFAPRALERSV